MYITPFHRWDGGLCRCFDQEWLIKQFECYFVTQKAKHEPLEWTTIRQRNNSIHSGLLKRAYAIALLCKKHIYGKPVSLSSELETYRPFESHEITGTPTLQVLMSGTLSLAFFPTCQGNHAYINMMLVFRPNEEDKTMFADYRTILSGDISFLEKDKIYLLKGFAPVTSIDGNSWQLASQMAKRALDHSNVKNRLKLLNWLITGSVDSDEDSVNSVLIGSKLFLFHQIKNGMRFLVPQKNKCLIQDPEVQNLIYGAGSVDQAWRIIAEIGFEQGTVHLPAPVKELHLLVGGMIQHLLFVIFRLNPERIILWHSDQSRKEAELIRQLFSSLDADEKVDLRLTDSHDMQKCYSDIRAYLEDHLNHSKTSLESVVINNTGGNRLMGFAALLVARDLEVPVVYRDVNQALDEMTGIQFPDKKTVFGDIKGINRWPEDGPVVNWERLSTKDKLPNTLDELKKQVFV